MNTSWVMIITACMLEVAAQEPNVCRFNVSAGTSGRSSSTGS